jgi:hypothetical protein
VRQQDHLGEATLNDLVTFFREAIRHLILFVAPHSALIDKARVPMTLVSLARNYGEHHAVMAGVRHASNVHVITMDDDLQNPPEEVQRLLEFAQHSGKEVIYTYYDDERHAAWRNHGSRFTNRVADFVLEKPRGLYLSSFRCMSSFVVHEITRYQGPFPYVDGLILHVTSDIDRLLVRHLPRAAGRSNYTLRRLLRLWMSMFVNFSVMPLRISTLSGFALSALGALGGTIVVAEALFFIAASGLGLVDGGGSAALGCSAVDPRHRRRVSRPTLSDGQRKTPIDNKGGKTERTGGPRRGRATGSIARARAVQQPDALAPDEINHRGAQSLDEPPGIVPII